MKNYTRKPLVMLALTAMLAALLLTTLAACTTTTDLAPIGSPSPSPSSFVSPSVSPSVGPSGLDPLSSPSIQPSPSEQPAAPTLSNQESAALAAQCDARISQMSEIQDSITVMLGDTTLIGVSFAPEYKGVLTTRINGIISDSVHMVAPSISNVKITNDPVITARIAALHDKQKDGGSANDVKDEFESIKKTFN